MNQQSNAPIDKGRVSVIIEKYQTNQVDQNTGQPIMKNRYATVGRATKWQPQQQGQQPRVDIEIDTLTVGAVAPIKLFIFWDSEQQNNNAPQQQGGFQGQQQTGHQQQGGYRG